METIILLLLVGGMELLAFLIGARVGQKVVNKEPIELPTINPVTLYKEHKEKEEMNKEQEKLNTMLDNINNYDGSSANQKEI
jgi:queuine/archaeosine tRNA-ribosyltransferase